MQAGFANHLFAIFFAITLTFMLIESAEEEKYSSKYDHIDVDTILNTPRLRNQYVDCYMDKGPCITPDARFLKERLPEAVVTKCRKCTEKQKIFFDKVVTWYTENEPETWNAILNKTIRDYQTGQTKGRRA